MSELTLRLITLLIPGAIAALIMERLTFHRPWSSFRFVLYSSLLGVGAYASMEFLLLPVAGIALILEGAWAWPRLSFWRLLASPSSAACPSEIAAACVFAVPFGLAASFLSYRKLLIRAARRIGASARFGDEEVWHFVLHSPEVGWVWVRDHRAGLVYQAWVELFSDRPPVREMLLREVKVFEDETPGDDARVPLYELAAMYVSGIDGDFTVEVPQLTEPGEAEHEQEAAERGK